MKRSDGARHQLFTFYFLQYSPLSVHIQHSPTVYEESTGRSRIPLPRSRQTSSSEHSPTQRHPVPLTPTTVHSLNSTAFPQLVSIITSVVAVQAMDVAVSVAVVVMINLNLHALLFCEVQTGGCLCIFLHVFFFAVVLACLHAHSENWLVKYLLRTSSFPVDFQVSVFLFCLCIFGIFSKMSL